MVLINNTQSPNLPEDPNSIQDLTNFRNALGNNENTLAVLPNVRGENNPQFTTGLSNISISPLDISSSLGSSNNIVSNKIPIDEIYLDNVLASAGESLHNRLINYQDWKKYQTNTAFKEGMYNEAKNLSNNLNDTLAYLNSSIDNPYENQGGLFTLTGSPSIQASFGGFLKNLAADVLPAVGSRLISTGLSSVIGPAASFVEPLIHGGLDFAAKKFILGGDPDFGTTLLQTGASYFPDFINQGLSSLFSSNDQSRFQSNGNDYRDFAGSRMVDSSQQNVKNRESARNKAAINERHLARIRRDGRREDAGFFGPDQPRSQRSTTLADSSSKDFQDLLKTLLKTSFTSGLSSIIKQQQQPQKSQQLPQVVKKGKPLNLNRRYRSSGNPRREGLTPEQTHRLAIQGRRGFDRRGSPYTLRSQEGGLVGLQTGGTPTPVTRNVEGVNRTFSSDWEADNMIKTWQSPQFREMIPYMNWIGSEGFGNLDRNSLRRGRLDTKYVGGPDEYEYYRPQWTGGGDQVEGSLYDEEDIGAALYPWAYPENRDAYKKYWTAYHRYTNPAALNGGQVATLAVSPKEYVVDAATMSALGNGNPDAGAKIMDNTIKHIRQQSFGTTKQPREIDGQETLIRGLSS